MWKGKFSSWEEAQRECSGYDADDVIEKTWSAMQQVRDGYAAYERDTLLHDSIIYSWPLLSALLKAALQGNKVLNVLDFGGSLGSSYYQNRMMLSDLDSLTWNIVDQPRIVEIGKKELQDDRLRFYSTVDECVRENRINFVLLSGALQYVEKPHDLLDDLIAVNADYFILDRTPFLRRDDLDTLSIQYTDYPYFKASLPYWFFNKKKVMEHFEEKFDLISGFSAYGNDEKNNIFSLEGGVFSKSGKPG